MSSALTDLFPLPIVQAPMAGGVSVPQLTAAVCEAGGLGFLAAGYKTADGMYQEIKQLRSLTGRPFGVNVFMPQPEYPAASSGSTGAAGAALPSAAAVDVYAHQLAGEATWFEAKLVVLRDNPVPVVSFHFGVPGREVVDTLHRVGTFVLAAATTPDEARAVERAGADGVIAQGVEAGGHQGTHRDIPELDGSGIGLLSLIAQVREAVNIPIVAARGIMRGGQIAGVRAAGASAAQLGTAFLATHESGANALHKQALTNPLFVRTELTRAFSGRPARGLVNRFLREHGPYAPAAYPEIHHLTSPLRKAAAKAGDAQGMALWAGQGHRMARELPAGQLVEVLAGELAAARASLAGGGAR